MSDQSCRNSSDRPQRPWTPVAASSSYSSLLVPSETNQHSSDLDSEVEAHPLDVQSHAQDLIHQAVSRQRFSIVDALWKSGEPDLENRAKKIGLCCVAPMIFADAQRDPVCVAGYCRDRLCPTCSRRRAAKVKRRLIDLVMKMDAPRFLTLTERDTTEPLKTREAALTAALRRFRHTKAWKKHVKGGVMVWEVTTNVAAGTWHPHVHLIIDGSYWSHAELWAEWKKCLGHDGSARIEACHSRADAARYLSKYLRQDGEVAFWPAKQLCEYATAKHRTRLIATFGTMHNANVDICDAEKKPPKLPRACISYTELRSQIDNGNETARAAAPLLARLGIAFRQLFFEFSAAGDCYADELPATCFEELGRLIEEMHDAQCGISAPEPEPPPPPDTQTLRLFDETQTYR